MYVSHVTAHISPVLFFLSVFFFFFFCFVFFLRAAPTARGGQIGAVAAGLHHSHRYIGSEARLLPATELTAVPDP